MRIASLLGLVMAATFTSQLSAQTIPTIEPGDRVRIESEAVSGEFNVVEVQPESLVVRDDSASPRVSVRIASLAELEIYRGTRSDAVMVAGLFAGTALGIGVGLAVGALVTDDSDSIAPSEAQVWTVLGGTLIGALAGVMVTSRGRERWEDVPLQEQISIAPSRDGGVVLGYEYRF